MFPTEEDTRVNLQGLIPVEKARILVEKERVAVTEKGKLATMAVGKALA